METCPKCGFRNDQIGVECPKCGVIFKKAKATPVPKAKLEVPKAKPEDHAKKLRQEWEHKEVITTKKIQVGSHHGGVENKLQKTGLFFGFIGLVALGLGLLAAKNSPIWFGIGMVAFIQGIIIKYIFEGAAEIIKLLKKSNGLPYGGSISVPKASSDVLECSHCGKRVSESNKYCPRCGRVFLPELRFN